jgi:hypothetical protein
MDFEKDIFISYAHIDNEALREGEKGWITDLHRALEIRLSQLMGEKPRIWRDLKLQGNDFFGDEIVEQFPKTALVVSILTPRYVKSEWCIREVETFYKVAQSNLGFKIQNKSRLFKVIKTPVALNEHPEVIRDILGYDFYQIEQGSGRPREFTQTAGSGTENAYWTKLDDLAHDIADLLLQMRSMGAPAHPNISEKSTPVPSSKSGKETIYLAEASSDLRTQRDTVKRELTEYGYTVLPDIHLPLIEGELKEAAANLLEQSKLSVHLIGSNYGIVPEGTQKSIVVVQNEVATEKSKSQKLSRIIWLPPGLATEDSRQQSFIELLRTNSEAQFGAEILETSIEDLKLSIHNKLKKLREQELAAASKPNVEEQLDEGPKSIYLICDQRDLDKTMELEDFFFNNGYEVLLPAFDGDETQIRIDHQENLKICNGVVIFYCEGNDLWLRAKTRDFLKIAGYGRTKPLNAKAIYLAPPDNVMKSRFRSLEAMVINGLTSFPDEPLREFLGKMKS